MSLLPRPQGAQEEELSPSVTGTPFPSQGLGVVRRSPKCPGVPGDATCCDCAVAEARADKGEPAPMGAAREVDRGFGSLGGVPCLSLGFWGPGSGLGLLGKALAQQSLGVSSKAASPQDLALPRAS